jgi:hypothetical protein
VIAAEKDERPMNGQSADPARPTDSPPVGERLLRAATGLDSTH